MTKELSITADTELTFLSDPGHGWLIVTPDHLTAVGLHRRDFSQYSYRTRASDLFYLEEDCDAPKFIEAWRTKFGRDPSVRETSVNFEAPCRLLPRM